MSAQSDSKPVSPSGRYDAAARRRARRTGRQRGCSVYIAAEELEAAGFDPHGPEPYYRVWGMPRGSVLVRLYREP
jgi:peptidoglycan hydrolase-like protein with peptidoglycan-binding domain